MKKQRKLKFRAWDKRHAIMSEVFSLGEQDVLGVWTEVILKYKKSDLTHKSIVPEELGSGYYWGMQGVCFYRANPNQIELLQFTGLKDRGNVEIYEGDICSDRKGDTCVIEFFKGSFVVVINSDVRVELSELYNNIEVVGNIYQNPELLKDKK